MSLAAWLGIVSGAIGRTIAWLAGGALVAWLLAGTLIESPDKEREIAWPMVLQAVVGDRQLLLSLPVIPLTYHVAAAATDDAANKKASTRLGTNLSFITAISLNILDFMLPPPSLFVALPAS